MAKEFTDAYMEMVAGFLTFPLKFPGTAVWRAMQVRLLLLLLPLLLMLLLCVIVCSSKACPTGCLHHLHRTPADNLGAAGTL